MKDISEKAKKEIEKIIFERAYIIEQELTKDDFFLAKMAGLKPEQISGVALEISKREIKETFKKK